MARISMMNIYAQFFQPNSFMPVILKGNIDFYHLIPLSVTLIFAEGLKFSGKQNLFCSFIPTFRTQSAWNLLRH